MKKLNYKALAVSAILSSSTLLSTLISLPTYAVAGNVSLEVEVKTAISMSIHSSSDTTTYGVIDPNDIKTVDTFNMDDHTPFGVSSAKTSMLPNTTDESMNSIVTVYTNSTDGFTLTVSDADEDTNLVSGSNKIPTGNKIEQGTSAWAIKGGLLDKYTAMSPLSTPMTVKTRDSKTKNGDATTFTYGVSTSGDQATGTYTDTIVYTATANEPIKIDYMQSFKQSDLPNIGDSKTLVDSRDNKAYTVARLADGNVWMTQNLAHDIDTAYKYTPENTDITGKWTPERSTIANGKISTTTWADDYNTPYSYNSGDGTYGNYYNWSAAVAMNDTSSITSGSVDTSICPKGWTLPKNGTTGKTYTNLGVAYGLPATSSTNSTAYQTLEQDPLNFVRAGYADKGSIAAQEQNGVYWSSAVTTYARAYALSFGKNYTPQATGVRNYGVSVRCVAR